MSHRAVAVAWGAALCGADCPFCVSGDAALLHGGGRSLLDEVAACGAGMRFVMIDTGGSVSTGGEAPLSGLLQHRPVARWTECIGSLIRLDSDPTTWAAPSRPYPNGALRLTLEHDRTCVRDCKRISLRTPPPLLRFASIDTAQFQRKSLDAR